MADVYVYEMAAIGFGLLGMIQIEEEEVALAYLYPRRQHRVWVRQWLRRRSDNTAKHHFQASEGDLPGMPT